MTAYAVLKRNRRPILSLLIPILLGAAMSTLIEMAQLYDPPRTCSALDVVSNGIGSAVGGVLAMALGRVRSSPLARLPLSTSADPEAVALLLLWIVYLVFPFFPVVSHTIVLRKLAVFDAAPLFDVFPFVSGAIAFYLVAMLGSYIRLIRMWACLGFLFLLIPAQIFLVTRQPVPSYMIGALIGYVLFALTSRYSLSTRTVAVGFLLALVVHGLIPFRFQAESVPFSWAPLAMPLALEWQTAMLILLGKLFFYWGAIWILRAAGARLWTATITVAFILAIVEAIQTHLPGRTPETTDPVIALLVGLALTGVHRRRDAAGGR